MKKITEYFYAIYLSIAAIIIVVVRFSHPEMTETQLFFEFWYLWLVIVAFLYLGYYVINR